MDEVMKLLDAMLSVGLKPGAVTYNTVFDGMLSIGLKPDVVACNTLIKGGRIEDALTLFREVLSKGVKTDATM
uniref:Pentatricopeptide repeat-containing protein n=1 Tax=Arundo donax TaxID=35708 RepID=A0A0A8ZQP8_ARUDO